MDGINGPSRATIGAAMFVRYAYPPNERGYCGPSDTSALLGQGRADAVDSDFRAIAQAFTGAWPYLEMIAAAAGIADPLDDRVVEAYWIGNELLGRVDPTVVGTTMEQLFQQTVGSQFSSRAPGGGANGPQAAAEGLAHHSFHVFCMYPWAGLLGHERMHAHALNVLDKCRIRPSQVIEIANGRVIVESQPLLFDAGQLTLGPAESQETKGPVQDQDAVGDLAVGDWVAVHWDWICDRLTETQIDRLCRYTLHHLAIVNDRAEQTRSAAPAG